MYSNVASQHPLSIDEENNIPTSQRSNVEDSAANNLQGNRGKLLMSKK